MSIYVDRNIVAYTYGPGDRAADEQHETYGMLCPDCAQRTDANVDREWRSGAAEPDELGRFLVVSPLYSFDSGESDFPLCCDDCSVTLDLGLTPEGEAYVRARFAEGPEDFGDVEYLQEWAELWPHLLPNADDDNTNTES